MKKKTQTLLATAVMLAIGSNWAATVAGAG